MTDVRLRENPPQNIPPPEHRWLISLKITNSILMNVTRPKMDDANYDAVGNLSDYDMVEDYRLGSAEAYSVSPRQSPRG